MGKLRRIIDDSMRWRSRSVAKVLVVFKGIIFSRTTLNRPKIGSVNLIVEI